MVMVSHRHEFIVLKTRKTAGTSVEMLLEPLCRPPGAVVTERTPTRRSSEGIVGRRLMPRRWFDRFLPGADWYNHMTAERVRAALGTRRWSCYRKVTTLRNPFDVAVSRYHWELMRHGLPEEADFDRTRARFREMALSGRFDCDHKVVHLDGRFVPDLVVRYESLEDDARRVAEALAPGRGPWVLPHTKRTSDRRRRPVGDYYDAASAAAIRRSAAWVFERMGYPDEPASTARPDPTRDATRS